MFYFYAGHPLAQNHFFVLVIIMVKGINKKIYYFKAVGFGWFNFN